MATAKICDMCSGSNAHRCYIYLRGRKGKVIKLVVVGDVCENCFERIVEFLKGMKL